MKTNKTAVSTSRKDTSVRLAGGAGTHAAAQSDLNTLRRSVMANLLWEDNFYQDGESITDTIKKLIPNVSPKQCFDIAVEARTQQKLRHVPLFIAREMARYPEHRKLVGDLLPQIILRADELAEFLAIYWKDGKCPVAKQVKIGLALAFRRFNAYQFAKYNRDNAIKLRDVMFLVHPKPDQGKEELYKQIAEDTLLTPDTWEVALSAGKDKKETWTRLIEEKKLGVLAFIRNLRNMEQVGVSSDTIMKGFGTVNPQWILPLNVLAAEKVAPHWGRQLEDLMYRCLADTPKLPGYTILVIDVSGSMGSGFSSKSDMSRLDAGAALAMLASEMCERVKIYATAGNDGRYTHATAVVKPHRGFALIEEIKRQEDRLGGGGIFTRQCLEYIEAQESEIPERIIIFSDSQDCDHMNARLPKPFGRRNYIVDVSAHTHGVNYKGLWTAEVSGWSEHFLNYIAGLEGLTVQTEE